MGISVIVAAAGINGKTKPATISINTTLGQPSTAEIATIDRTGGYFPRVGNEISVLDQNDDVLFAGNCNEVERFRPGTYNQDIAESRTSCTDLNFALTRRLAGEYEWIGQTLLAIVTDIVNNSLSGDLTDITNVATGPVIPSFIVSYSNVETAFNRLKTETGYAWHVDYLNKLHFFLPGTVSCPWGISDGTNFSRFTVRETREDYCNWAVARVLKALRAAETQEFVGNGSATSFELAYPCAQQPTILLNGVENTVGITTVDTGKDWYWSPESKEIRQDDLGVVLTGADTLAVTYVGIEQTYVEFVDTDEISARATAENNSGIYQRFIEIEALTTRADAQAIVENYVLAHNQLSLVATIETNDHIEPSVRQTVVGQTISLLPEGYLTLGDFLITEVNISHFDCNDQAAAQWAYRITAVKGPKLKNFVEAFGDLIGGGSSGSGVTAAAVPDQAIQRTLLLKDTTVGNDIADHTTVYKSGLARRITGTLRLAIASALTVRVKRYRVTSPPSAAATLITITVPYTTAVDVPVTSTAFATGMEDLVDGDVLIWDVTASDGQVVAAGVAAFTLEWTAQ